MGGGPAVSNAGGAPARRTTQELPCCMGDAPITQRAMGSPSRFGGRAVSIRAIRASQGRGPTGVNMEVGHVRSQGGWTSVLEAPAKLLSLRRSRSSRREDPSHGTRRPRSRGAPPPRRRRQEVAWSICARPGLLRRRDGASATGPARGPRRTRGGARRRPRPRQDQLMAWVSGAQVEPALQGLW